MFDLQEVLDERLKMLKKWEKERDGQPPDPNDKVLLDIKRSLTEAGLLAKNGRFRKLVDNV